MSNRYLVAEAVISVKNCRNDGYGMSKITVPYSGLVMAVLQKIKQGGYISSVEEVVSEDKKRNISVNVRFDRNGLSLIRKVKIISKPSARVYYNVDKMKHINMRNPFDLVIMSTPLGVMTISEAIEHGMGGEAICAVF